MQALRILCLQGRGIFEAMTEEVCGGRGRALELYRRSAERWPDEMNFHAGVIRLQSGN